ncbi:MAG: DUF374 domain-containing protein, partial [Myxococcota bacterium]
MRPARISRDFLSTPAGMRLAQATITGIARTLLATTAFSLEGEERMLETCRGLPPVYAFWHGKQLPLLRYTPRWPLITLVSHSKDGELLARVLEAFGHRIVRGSSSRGGAEGFAEVRRLMMAEGYAPCFAADGPRGPLHKIKPGAVRMA